MIGSRLCDGWAEEEGEEVSEERKTAATGEAGGVSQEEAEKFM